MPGPGDYLPDSSEGIDNLDDLPQPIVKKRSKIQAKCPCPHCSYNCRKHRTAKRRLRHLGNRSKGRPVILELSYSVHCCPKCKIFFNIDTTDLAAPHAHYTNAVVELAVRVVVEDALPYREASWHLWRDHRVFVPFATIQNWVEAAGGKKTPACYDRRLSRWSP